jgi:hypothetical protein
VTGTQSEWDRYRRWNNAIADVVYAPSQAGLPVYLDLEDDVLDEIRDLAEPAAADPTTGLVAAVAGTLRLTSGPSDLLLRHLLELDRWRRTDRRTPPPTLGLLALLSLAAENMHEAEGLSSNNFYGRLGQLLELTEKQTGWFADAYRAAATGPAVSGRLWGSLADWLEVLEGNRGLPTAYAETHTHIGPALSQALVRHSDRERLEDLFVLNGLAPRSSLPSPEMEQLIDEWVGRDHCPASNSLIRLWKGQSGARERIVDVALAELEVWDGSASTANAESVARRVDSVRVTALLRQFPRRQLVVGLAAPIRSTEPIEELDLLDDNGSAVGHVDLVPSAAGLWTMADPAVLDVASFLAGQTSLTRASTEVLLTRRPRRLVVLRHNDLLQSFVETERVGLGDDSLVLSRADIADKVAEMLQLVARPGFERHDSLPGLPDDWTLFDAVQVLAPIPRELMSNRLFDFNALQPIASSQVLIDGGLKIPGNIAKWSPNDLPEVRITVDSASRIEAHLTCRQALTLPEPEPRHRTADEPVLVWDLAQEFLSDGDYELRVLADGEPVGRPTVLRLRSADHPAVEVDDLAVALRHDPIAPLFGVAASRNPASSTSFAVAPDASSDTTSRVAPSSPASVPAWYAARQQPALHQSTPPEVVMPGAASDSCVVTGFHHMMVETAYAGMKSVEGICRHCGLAKRYPTRAKHKRASRTSKQVRTAPSFDVTSLPTVRNNTAIDWATGFDVLCHLRSGKAAAFGRVAAQIEAGSVFNDVFGRHLAALGHLEIERHQTTLATTAWRINDPALIEVDPGTWHLVGFRSERFLVALDDTAYEYGLDVHIDSVAAAPPIVSLNTDDRPLLDSIAATLTQSGFGPVRIIPDAARALASVLPPLSALARTLPTVIMQGARTTEHWNSTTARFARADRASQPGAYRLGGFARSYVYRTVTNVSEHTATVGDARLVKYLAAADSATSLIGYDPATRVLYVPLGADLPGLFGRAAVFCSGRLPHESPSAGLLEYRNVSSDLAARLNQLLMS